MKEKDEDLSERVLLLSSLLSTVTTSVDMQGATCWNDVDRQCAWCLRRVCQAPVL